MMTFILKYDILYLAAVIINNDLILLITLTVVKEKKVKIRSL